MCSVQTVFSEQGQALSGELRKPSVFLLFADQLLDVCDEPLAVGFGNVKGRKDCDEGALDDIDLRLVIELADRADDGGLPHLHIAFHPRRRCEQPGFGFEAALHTGGDLLGQPRTSLLVGILGEFVDFLVVWGGVGHDRPHLRHRRFVVEARVDVHQAAVGVRHPRGDVDETRGRIDRCPVLKELGHLGPGLLQRGDLVAEVTLELLECELLLFVVVVDGTDVGERDPEFAHPPKLVESEQVGGSVLFVAVAHPFGLGEQAELVIMPDGVDRRAGQARQFTRAPSHGRSPSSVPCCCRMRASLCGGPDIDALAASGYRETMTARFDRVEALVFDMFGTVVDWRSSVAAEVALHLRNHVPDLDAHEFADRWRAQYQPSMERVRSGGREFVRLDVLHRENLETVLAEAGVNPASIPTGVLEETNLAWHRLDPWPDAVPGLTQLKERFIIAPLSNANIRLALDVAKRAELPWDAILGAEVAGAYKPDPAAYLRTADVLGLEPNQVCMVAAHNGDLAAAAELGLRTAFVRRPTEYGPAQTSDLEPTGDWDVIVDDFEDLARQIV